MSRKSNRLTASASQSAFLPAIRGANSALFAARKGFTLVELMVSSVILVFAILSCIALLSQCTVYVADMRLRARSSQILQQQIENMRLLSWTSMQSLPSSFSDPADTNNVYAGSISSSSYQTYNSTVTVLRVTVQVTWTNRHSRVVSNSMTTLISQGGINNTSL